MAINKKLIHFNTKANFITQKLSANINDTLYYKYDANYNKGTTTTGAPDVKYSSIVFIKDDQKIWTHGQLYSCSDIDSFDWSKISNKPSWITSTKPTYTASEVGALPSSTKYAGSATAGGSATSAVKLDTTSAGSSTVPVYFSGGKPVATDLSNTYASKSATLTSITDINNSLDTLKAVNSSHITNSGATSLNFTISYEDLVGGVNTDDTVKRIIIPAATSTNAGLMLPADKTFIENINGAVTNLENSVAELENRTINSKPIVNNPVLGGQDITLTGYTKKPGYIIKATDTINEAFARMDNRTMSHDVTITTLSNHPSRTDNPHQVTKAQVGLGNVDNTSDANKPISTATLTALNAKASTTTVNNLTTTVNKHTSDISSLSADVASMTSFPGMETIFAYGVEWDTSSSDPKLTRIGNLDLHRSLPIQSQLAGCVAKGNVIQYWLNPTNWNLKKVGGTAKLDGTDGTVRIYCPQFYIKSVVSGTKRQVWISPVKIDDTWYKQEALLVDAWRCSLKNTSVSTATYINSLPTNSLVSVYNIALTGGNSNNSREAGKPKTGMSLSVARTRARLTGSEVMSYSQYKNIFYWLYVIEYANFNCQAAYSSALDANGYHQGGLGNGVTTLDATTWSRYNEKNPVSPLNVNLTLGNRTGMGSITASSVTIRVPRWRGFDNPFGDVYTVLDGCLLLGPGGSSGYSMYVCDTPSNYSNTVTSNYKFVGSAMGATGYISEWDLGDAAHMVPASTSGTATTYMCDRFVIPSATNTPFAIIVGGATYDSGLAGIGTISAFSPTRGDNTVAVRTVSTNPVLPS